MTSGNKMFNALAWSAIERVSIQIIQFILGVVLARLLTPEEYGIMAILVVFIVLSQVFIDSGFSKALIQKKTRNEDDKSTVFLFNIGISLFFYILLYLTAPLIANFYQIDDLILYLRIFAISLIINALFAVPHTLLSIKLDFKLITKINLISVLISGVLAIYLAYNGFGVWSLIFQVLTKSSVTALLMWGLIKWLPNWKFSKHSFKQLFSYGSKLLASSLLARFFSELNSILIGKYISARSLGFYTRGIQFSDVLFNMFNDSINRVLLPALTSLQDQKKALRDQIKIITKTASLITVPIFILLAILAEPIILVLLTEKWELAIPILQLFSVARLITIISIININVLYIIGRTDLVLKQQYLCIIIRVVLVLSALKFGIVAIAWAELITSTIHFFINSYYPGKIIGYGSINQVKDISRIYFAGLIMMIPLLVLLQLIESDLLVLIIGPLVSIPLYYYLLRLLKVSELISLQDQIIKFVRPNK